MASIYHTNRNPDHETTTNSWWISKQEAYDGLVRNAQMLGFSLFTEYHRVIFLPSNDKFVRPYLYSSDPKDDGYTLCYYEPIPADAEKPRLGKSYRFQQEPVSSYIAEALIEQGRATIKQKLLPGYTIERCWCLKAEKHLFVNQYTPDPISVQIMIERVRRGLGEHDGCFLLLHAEDWVDSKKAPWSFMAGVEQQIYRELSFISHVWKTSRSFMHDLRKANPDFPWDAWDIIPSPPYTTTLTGLQTLPGMVANRVGHGHAEYLLVDPVVRQVAQPAPKVAVGAPVSVAK